MCTTGHYLKYHWGMSTTGWEILLYTLKKEFHGAPLAHLRCLWDARTKQWADGGHFQFAPEALLFEKHWLYAFRRSRKRKQLPKETGKDGNGGRCCCWAWTAAEKHGKLSGQPGGSGGSCLAIHRECPVSIGKAPLLSSSASPPPCDNCLLLVEASH